MSNHVGIKGKSGAHSFWRGWPITWDGNAWYFDDTGNPLPGYGGVMRPCAHCGATMSDHESDACLGDLPGVDNACCGHGQREESYIRFVNGIIVHGFTIEPREGERG